MSISPQFKSYPKGQLKIVTIKAEKTRKGQKPLFNYNGQTNIKSETVGKEYFKSQGYNAKLTENVVWINLFNQLIYKNLLKMYENGEITTADKKVFDSQFYQENEMVINKLFNGLMKLDLKEYIKNNYKKSTKTLTERRLSRREKVLEVVGHLENNQVLIIMEYLIKDYIHNKRGFPDLIVWNDSELFFSEVKANTDISSRRQVKAHNILNYAGVDVVLLSINKSKRAAKRQRKYYSKNRRLATRDYKGRYDLKINMANRKFENLENQNSNHSFLKLKEKLDKNDFYYFIAYLNVLDDENIVYLDEDYSIEDKVLKERSYVKYLSIMADGKSLEDKKMFKEAIEEYKKLVYDKDNFNKTDAYFRICICYRALKDIYSEFYTIKEVLEDDSIADDDKTRFKNRALRKMKKKEYSDSEKICPICNINKMRVKSFNNYDITLYRCKKCDFIRIE